MVTDEQDSLLSEESQKMVQDESSKSQDAKIVSLEKKQSIFKRFWLWFTNSKGRVISVVFLFSFVTLMIILGALGIDPTRVMLEIVYWFEDKTGKVGLYLGVGIISAFGNTLVFIPSMYAVVLMFIAVLDVNVWILGAAAGIGASIGQLVAWFVGRATEEIVDDKMLKRLRKAQKWVERGLAPLLIFFFAATPLPDEVLLITIGLVNYSLLKTLLFCFLGKITLTVSLSVLANLLSTTNFGKWLLDSLFNLTPEMLQNGTIPEASSVWTSILIWVIAATLMVIAGFIDWVELYDKRKCRKEEKLLREIFDLAKSNPDLLKDSFIEISEATYNQTDIFPEESLWLFEERLHEKRDVFLRKTLLTTEAILESDSTIEVSEKWIDKLRTEMEDQTTITYKQQMITAIKYPPNVLELGIIISNLRILAFKTKLQNILKDKKLINNSEFLTRKLKRQLLRKKISVEVLLETSISESSRILGIGLREGVYLRKIPEINQNEKLILWLHLLSTVTESKEITDLMIYTVKFSTDVREGLEIPEDILTACPI